MTSRSEVVLVPGSRGISNEAGRSKSFFWVVGSPGTPSCDAGTASTPITFVHPCPPYSLSQVSLRRFGVATKHFGKLVIRWLAEVVVWRLIYRFVAAAFAGTPQLGNAVNKTLSVSGPPPSRLSVVQDT
jgi:hypothetical protein